MSRAVDPGWGAAARRAPLILVPTRGMRTALTDDNGLVVMRMVWITFVAVMVVIGAVVVAIDRSLPGGGADGRVVAAAVAGVGIFLQVVSTKFVPVIAGKKPATVRAAAQRAFFIRVAFAEPAALLGFMGFVLSGNVAVYAAGFAVGLAGMTDAAPTGRWIAAGQEELAASGSDVDLLEALVTGGLTR